MLDGLDAVDWSALEHAYGAATDLPELLRQAATESAEEAEEALRELYGCIMHQGTVYPATAAAVPFLDIVLAAPAIPRIWSVPIPHDSPVVEAARRGLAHLAETRPDHPAVPVLAEAGVDLAGVEPLLRRLLRPTNVVDGGPDEDGYARAAAARALWRLGVPPTELTAVLIEAIQDRWARGDPIALLVEMGAVDAAAELDRLADQPRRITVTATTADNLVWSDEALQTRLRAAAGTLRGGADRQHSPSAST
jgi:hypothetical protein